MYYRDGSWDVLGMMPHTSSAIDFMLSSGVCGDFYDAECVIECAALLQHHRRSGSISSNAAAVANDVYVSSVV